MSRGLGALEARQAKREQAAHTLRFAALRKQIQVALADEVIDRALDAWTGVTSGFLDFPPSPFQCDVLRLWQESLPPEWEIRHRGLLAMDVEQLSAWLA